MKYYFRLFINCDITVVCKDLFNITRFSNRQYNINVCWCKLFSFVLQCKCETQIHWYIPAYNKSFSKVCAFGLDSMAVEAIFIYSFHTYGSVDYHQIQLTCWFTISCDRCYYVCFEWTLLQQQICSRMHWNGGLCQHLENL